MRSNQDNQSGFTLVEIMIVVAIIGLLAAIAIPNYMKARATAQTNTCIANLKTIHGAKQEWATDNRLPGTAVPTESDLFGPQLYIRVLPVCPAGGAYDLRAISRRPRCSIADHQM